MASGAGFWATVELLTGMGGSKEPLIDAFNDDIEDWLETMAHRTKMQRERAELKGDDDSEEDESNYGALVDCR